MTSTSAPVRAAGREHSSRGAAVNAVTRSFGLALALLVLCAALLLSLGVGARALPPTVVWDALFFYDGSDFHAIVRDARLPRTVIGVLAGVALGGCGALIQAYTRNPLADPGILGVNAGATFAITMGAGFLGLAAPLQYVWLSLAGALSVTLLVYLIGRASREGATPVRMTLTGVALGAILTGLSSIIILKNFQVFQALRLWGIGSLGGRDADVILTVAPFIAVGLIIAVLASSSLNAIALGDDLGASLGVNIPLTRGLAIAGVTLLAGGAVALAGPIAFVGLMVPHAVRWFTGPDQRWILAYSVVAAPVLLLVSDVIGRIVLPDGELPVGIVTAIVGAPVLILLARRKKVSGL